MLNYAIKLIDRYVFRKTSRSSLGYYAKTGTQETTKHSEFFDITSVIRIDGLPQKYHQIILGIFPHFINSTAEKLIKLLKFTKVDQPGIGGLEINEEGYLEKFGPGQLI